jgi:DNA-binding response OmpR family regulator
MNDEIKLLFVDDEEPLRILVKNQLLLEGFAVDTTDDGDTAIEALKKNTYDVVLLDIRMPRLNGIEVLKFMKQNKMRPRIVMLTAVDDLAVAIEAVKAGANDYVTKPYDLDKLLGCIRRVLAK